MSIVDPVTNVSANLCAELAERLGAEPPAVAGRPIYAVTCRRMRIGGKWRLEEWEHEPAVRAALPTLPLWLSLDECVPPKLEATNEDICRGLRITGFRRRRGLGLNSSVRRTRSRCLRQLEWPARPRNS